MDYGLPQDFYKNKFTPKLERNRRYREFENSYPLGMSGISAIPVSVTSSPMMAMAHVPGVPVGVSLGSLPDPQIFFTEPNIRDVKTKIFRSSKLTVNITGPPSKVDELFNIINDHLEVVDSE